MLAKVGSALALFVDRCFDDAGAGSGAQRRGRYVVLPMPVALATALTLPSCPKAVWTHALCHKSASPWLLLTGRHASEVLQSSLWHARRLIGGVCSAKQLRAAHVDVSWFMEMLQRSPIGLSARRRPLSFPAAGEAHSFPVLPHAMGNDAEVVHQGKGRHSRLWSDVCLCHQLHHRCGTQNPAFRMESR